jgi:4-amino-4-deoxy-L-arabinose transferase-like glycosyltransferase
MTVRAPATTPPSSAYALQWSSAWFAVGLALIALAPRLYVALEWAHEPVWDAHYYDFGARRIAAGHGYSDDLALNGVSRWHPWCHYPVGYSAALAAFYFLFGSSGQTAAIFNSLVGAALPVAVWALVRCDGVEGRARVAALLVALYPGLVLYAGIGMTEPLSALLCMGALGLAAAGRTMRERRSAARSVGGPVHESRGEASGAARALWVGACVVLGLGALVRPQSLLLAPVLGWAALGPHRSFRRGLAVAAASCVVVLLPVLPWTLRNCRVMDGCALVSTNGGWNLAIGALPRGSGRFETLRAEDGCPVVTGQVAQDRCWRDVGLRAIAQDPAAWLARIPKKLSFTFDHESFPVEYLREANKERWPESRRVRAREGLTVVHGLVWLVASAALLRAPFRRQPSPQSHESTRWRESIRWPELGLWVVALGIVVADLLQAPPHFVWPWALFCTIAPWIPTTEGPRAGVAGRLASLVIGTTCLTHAIFFGEDRYHMVAVPAALVLVACAPWRTRMAA